MNEVQENKKHYAIVQEKQTDNEDDYCIRGSFSMSHLSGALGTDVSSGIGKAQSIMELHYKLDS